MTRKKELILTKFFQKHLINHLQVKGVVIVFFQKYKQFKKIFILIIVFTVLKGCSSTDMKSFSNKTPKLDLFNFFIGETIAYGIFEDRFGNLKETI